MIQKWMLTDLNLKSTELMVYAIIYGFSQDGQGECWASLDYFQLWTGASRSSIIRAINSLEEKGLIERRRREGTTSALRVVGGGVKKGGEKRVDGAREEKGKNVGIKRGRGGSKRKRGEYQNETGGCQNDTQ